MNIDDLDIPTVVKIARIKKRMTQAEFAKYLKVGQNTVSNWETGKTTPTGEHLRKIFRIINS